MGAWGKKLGKEEIFVEISEWEMQSMLKALIRLNKTLYTKIKRDLIDEALKEGYEFSFVLPETKHKGETEL